MLWPDGSKSKPYVSSAFGPRRAPVAGASTYHRGTDFSHTFGRIRAIAAGRVVAVGTPRGWLGGGTQVWIQHDGFFSKSLHMVAGSPSVRVGQWVPEGQDLGAMGETGTATDVHLHFEITLGNVHYYNTGQVDPVPFINARLASTAGGSTGGAVSRPEEDDMYTDEDRELMTQVLTVAKNTHAGVWYGGKSGGKTFRFGVLPISAHNQTLIANLTAQVGALSAAVQALASASGADPAAILAAVESGVKNAMKDVTFSVDSDG